MYNYSNHCWTLTGATTPMLFIPGLLTSRSAVPPNVLGLLPSSLRRSSARRPTPVSLPAASMLSPALLARRPLVSRTFPTWRSPTFLYVTSFLFSLSFSNFSFSENPPCCHGCNNNSVKNGPCTCKLCEWGVGCANCVKSGKARCTFALNAPEFLAATERTFAMNAAHPQSKS